MTIFQGRLLGAFPMNYIHVYPCFNAEGCGGVVVGCRGGWECSTRFTDLFSPHFTSQPHTRPPTEAPSTLHKVPPCPGDYLPPESPVFATRSVVTSTNSRSPIVPPPSRPDTTADAHPSHLPKFNECSQGHFSTFLRFSDNRQKGLKWRKWPVPMPDCLTPPNGVAPGLEPGWALTPRTPD